MKVNIESKNLFTPQTAGTAKPKMHKEIQEAYDNLVSVIKKYEGDQEGGDGN